MHSQWYCPHDAILSWVYIISFDPALSVTYTILVYPSELLTAHVHIYSVLIIFPDAYLSEQFSKISFDVTIPRTKCQVPRNEHQAEHP